MDARELEALSMLSRGFIDLKDANPELAYNLLLDILSGINEYGLASLLIYVFPYARSFSFLLQQSGRPTTYQHYPRALPTSSNSTRYTDDRQRRRRNRTRSFG